MSALIADTVAKASWLRFFVFLAALLIFSQWMFRDGGAYATANAAAMGLLPEQTPGFSGAMPSASFERLGDAIGKYRWFQAIDVVFAILNFLVFSSAIALGLNKFKLAASPVRYILLAPALYLVAELFENPLLGVLAVLYPRENAALAGMQQLATNVKWGASAASMLMALIFILALLIASIFNALRAKTGK